MPNAFGKKKPIFTNDSIDLIEISRVWKTQSVIPN
jgi:hypothetical protein